ncbi:MAG: aldehyde dehydrogenase EutE [Oscillospiraceae bacterium]|jgi:propionaldehyde dehydrogenase|nr:aldehyde dehydrogenase EutE [Oscillospiraceae bacterium]
MALTKEEIRRIAASMQQSFSGTYAAEGQCLFDDVHEAINTAVAAQRRLMELSLEERGKLIEAMRTAARENAEALAVIANEETGYGKVPHKILKNLLAANKTPGIEDLHPTAYSGDDGLTLVETAPYGVIGAITPSTNPTATIINNAISMIAAGNAVVFNPHPAAKRASQKAMELLNSAIIAAGGPNGLITAPKEPTMDTSNVIMTHKAIKMLAVTGGEAVVHVAMRSGKKCVAAGPGNPPVIVDETARIPQAAKDIVDGASFDNNVLCVAEKEVFVVESVADALMNTMQQHGAFRVFGADIDKVVRTVLVENGGKYAINRKFVGRNASYILRESGVQFTGEPVLVIAEVDRAHPFVEVEMLMPVLGIVRVANFEEALRESLRAEQGNQHSAMIHSSNIHNMSKAARAMNTTIFVKNAPSYSGLGFGGEGHTTLTIATPTGEGLTSAKSFTRARRCVLKGDFRII